MPDDILNRLTWQDYVELMAYWAKHPPVQVMVQTYLGIKVEEEPKQELSPPMEGGPSPFAMFVDNLNR